MPFCYRDMVGDLLYFVHRGSGTFATEFGPIAYEPGDYVLLPKGTTFRQMPDDRGRARECRPTYADRPNDAG